MTNIAWISIFIACALQGLFDFGAFFLPSMAVSEGVAVYPKLSDLLPGVLYRFSPYFLFLAALLLSRDKPKIISTKVATAVVVGVASPLLAIMIAQTGIVSVAVFRAQFWPVRPAIQICLFVIVLVVQRLFFPTDQKPSL